MRVRAVGLGFPRSPQRKLLRADRAKVGVLPACSIPSLVERTGSHSRPKAIGYGAHLSCRTLSLGRLTSTLPSLDMKTAR
jgi:hypothetical protein